MKRTVSIFLLVTFLMLVAGCKTGVESTISSKSTQSSRNTKSEEEHNAQESSDTAAFSSIDSNGTQNTTHSSSIASSTRTSSAPVSSATSASQTSQLPPPKPIATKYLKNTYAKLTIQKSLIIGYIGGSITYGMSTTNRNTKSWAALTTAWFKQTYPSASITDTNQSIGATGSLFGAGRIKDQLMTPHKPDLIFVEFTVNDYGQSYTQAQSERWMESLVLTIYECNPYADIVFVYTTDTNFKGGDIVAKTAFNNVAEHYGLLTVDFGAAMRQEFGTSGSAWIAGGTYFADYVHPNNKGHAKYAEYMQAFLQSNLIPGTEVKKQEVPDPLGSDLIIGAKLFTPAQINSLNPGKGKLSSFSYDITGDSTIEIVFTGKSVGIACIFPGGMKIKAIIDGKQTIYYTSLNDDGSQGLFSDDLPEGQHTIRISRASSAAELRILGVFAA